MFVAASQALSRLTNIQCIANCRSTLPLRLGRVKLVRSLPVPTERSYANSAPVSRPKAHTGRTTSTRKPRAAAAPKVTGKTKAPAKKTTSTAKKPRAKTAAAKPKTKTKTKAKAKPKKKVKKPLTEKQLSLAAAKKKRSDLKALKEIALAIPSGKPYTAWTVFFAEQTKGKSIGAQNVAKNAGAEYRNLSTERREHYNHIANQNKATNTIQHRQWIESHTPEVILKANNARALLRRRTKGRWQKIQDDRQVKRPRSSYISFSVERQASGDFAGIPLGDAAKRVGQEWKALSAAERQPYIDLQAQEMARYTQEVKTVFDRDVQHKTKKTTT